MTGMREKDQSDFDLETFIDLFDEALTSDDPSVQKTLQHLMVIAALARNHDKHNARSGPLRRLFDDQNNIIRRLERLEASSGTFGKPDSGYPGRGPGPLGPYHPPQVGPGTGTWPSNPGTIPPFPPGTIWAGSSTSYAYDSTSPAMNAVAERVEDLLKSPKYQGSSIGTVNVKTT